MRSTYRLALSSLLPALLAMLVISAPAHADHYDHLLAPKSVCADQLKDRVSTDRMEQSMQCMHRYARRKVGVRKLERTPKLMRSAAAKAQDILDCQNFSHTACGLDAFYWLHKLLYTASGCYSLGENISLGSSYKGDVRYAMSGWLHSDGHRQSLLDPRFSDIGIGVVRGNYHGYNARSWTAHFGDRC